jgi:hypothetical protein
VLGGCGCSGGYAIARGEPGGKTTETGHSRRALLVQGRWRVANIWTVARYKNSADDYSDARGGKMRLNM